jgi:hypothetical protein
MEKNFSFFKIKGDRDGGGKINEIIYKQTDRTGGGVADHFIYYFNCSTAWDSFFGIFILFKKSFPNLKKYLDVILRRSK